MYVILPAKIFYVICIKFDRLSSLVVDVPGYRSIGPVSILSVTRFSE
jgi:hypothetical protein